MKIINLSEIEQEEGPDQEKKDYPEEWEEEYRSKIRKRKLE